jgi:hypothetical protein
VKGAIPLPSAKSEIRCKFAIMRKFRAWRYRLGVRTEDSQSSNPGSIPGSATKYLPPISCHFHYFQKLIFSQVTRDIAPKRQVGVTIGVTPAHCLSSLSDSTSGARCPGRVTLPRSSVACRCQPPRFKGRFFGAEASSNYLASAASCWFACFSAALTAVRKESLRFGACTSPDSVRRSETSLP